MCKDNKVFNVRKHIIDSLALWFSNRNFMMNIEKGEDSLNAFGKKFQKLTMAVNILSHQIYKLVQFCNLYLCL